MTGREVLEELTKLGRANMADYMRVGPGGDPVLNFAALTRDQAAALVEVTVEDFLDGRGEDAREVRRVKFKLADKRGALDLLGKHLGLFKDRVEHTGKDGGPVAVKQYTDIEAARLIARLLKKVDASPPARDVADASPPETGGGLREELHPRSISCGRGADAGAGSGDCRKVGAHPSQLVR